MRCYVFWRFTKSLSSPPSSVLSSGPKANAARTGDLTIAATIQEGGTKIWQKKLARSSGHWSLSILMDSSDKTARVPFIPVRWKSETRLRTPALYDVKVSTLELFGRQLWFDYKEIVVPTGGNGRDRLNPLPSY